jgi:hypothetical protein
MLRLLALDAAFGDAGFKRTMVFSGLARKEAFHKMKAIANYLSAIQRKFTLGITDVSDRNMALIEGFKPVGPK